MNAEEKLLRNIFSNYHERETMTLKTDKFARKPFYVDAIQVTGENMEAVAEWCQGNVVKAEPPKASYIKVRVHRPMTPRQTQAFVGDWVLYAGTGFKVYNDRAFRNHFETAVVTQNNTENQTTVFVEKDETLPGEVIDGNG